MYSILKLKTVHKHLLGLTAFVLSLGVATILGSGSAHAATLNVSGGCTLPIAINSVNAGADQAGCTATGPAYATDDTITIPAGTITLTADLPTITESVVINGAEMGSTTVDGDGNTIFITTGPEIVIKDLRITKFSGSAAVYSSDSSISILNVEIDGAGSSGGSALFLNASTGVRNIVLDNIYIHNLSENDSIAVAQLISQGGATMNVQAQSITINDIHTTGTGNFLIGFFVIFAGGTGSINPTISNVTIDDFTSDDFVTSFGVFGQANSGSDSSTTANVQNVTVTGLRGVTGTGQFNGSKSAAFYAGAASGNPGDIADVTLNVSNSVFVDNLSDGISSNCAESNLSNVFGGDEIDANPQIVSLGHNISDDSTCTSFTQPGDQQNVSNILSTLGPLQNNGGAVPTRALLAGSPAIAAGGSVLGITTDARGVARPGSNPSVGAYQYVLAETTTAPTTVNAPNTGIKSSSQVFNVLAGISGLGLVTYIFLKQRRLN